MLTGDLKTNQIGWLSVWCRKFKINFGHVNFPAQGIKTFMTFADLEQFLKPHFQGKNKMYMKIFH